MARFAMLDVFSGMPNPVWPADDDLVAPMLDRAAPDADEAPPLGYRGFRIVDTDTDPEQLAATTADAIGDYSDVARIFGNPDDERALLEAGVNAGAISDDLRGYVADAIGSPSSSGPAVSAIAEPCPPCGGIDAPSFMLPTTRRSSSTCSIAEYAFERSPRSVHEIWNSWTSIARR